MRHIHRPLTLLLGLNVALTFSCSGSSSGSGSSSPAQTERNFAETLQQGGFTAFASALHKTGLMEQLERGTWTVLAPTNEAFESPQRRHWLYRMTDDELVDLLLYHVVDAGPTPGTVVGGMTELVMANGDEVLLDVVDGDLYANEARVTELDIQASNGVVHAIDSVLVPPARFREALIARGGFDTLVSAIDRLATNAQALGMGERTLLAPTDAAFERLPPGFLDGLGDCELASLLSYHTLLGRVVASDALAAELIPSSHGADVLFEAHSAGLCVNGASAPRFNLKTEQGVIHVVDSVLTPPPTLLELLSRDDRFSALVSALRAAGLDANLAAREAGPLTLFAPTNDAFAALPPGALENWLGEPGAPTLAHVLNFHLVEGAWTANDVAAHEGGGLMTLLGRRLEVGTTSGALTVGDALVLYTNGLASNGIVHGIDRVLVPDGVVLP